MPARPSIAAALLAAFVAAGCSSSSRSSSAPEAGPPPAPTPDAGTPSSGACTTGSVCGGRQYCGTGNNCLCVKTSEGSLACAGLPPTCHMPLCNTTRDCISLGAGYVCDTPDSGCSSDPPAALKRCLPPCGVDSSAEWPEALGVMLEQLPAIRDGGVASLGSDDRNDLVITRDGGTRMMVLRGPRFPLLTVVFTGNAQADVRGDLNQDNKVDYMETESADGSVIQRQALWDTKFTGTMDLRDTRTLDVAAHTFTDTVEGLVDGGWQVISTRSGPAQDNQGNGCDGFAGFPSDTSGPSVSPIGIASGADISIVNNRGPGACSDADAFRLARAIRRSLTDGLTCLKDLNPELALEIEANLANGRNLTLPNGQILFLGSSATGAPEEKR